MENNKRKRGVVVSRTKLEAAMLKAGIKTQAALAEEIAKSENIDLPPKDTVNRAFRQEKISPATLARIATVLGVESYTLYLSKEEESAQQQSDFSQRKPNKKSSFAYIGNYGVLLVVVIAVVVFGLWQGVFTHKQQPYEERIAPPLGRYSIVINPYSKQSLLLAEPIKNLLSEKFDSIIIKDSFEKRPTMSIDLAQKYQADAVITIRTTNIGRYLGVQFFIYFQGVEKLIWTDSLLKVDLTQQKQAITASFKPVVFSFFGAPLADNINNFDFADIQTLENYLNARHLLDDQGSEINIKRAQGLLDAALDTFTDFAKAHATRCESYIAESWNGNEKQLLEAALKSCVRAISLSPTDSYVNTTLAWAYRRTGRIPQSVAIYEKLLKAWPNNVEALSGLGNTLLTAYRQELKEYPDALKRATDYLIQASVVEPDYWRHQSDLGISQYTAGDMKGATASLEVSARLHPNELSFVNVGTLNFCQGNLVKAKSFYQKASEFAPQSHLGYEFQGTSYYFLGDYEKSAQLRQQAIDLLSIDGGEHKMWGGLADSYRLSNQKQKAEEAYLKALTIIERDELRGNLEAMDKIHRHYYRLILTEINPDNYSREFSTNTDYNFSTEIERDLDTSTYITLAKIENILNNKQNAIRAFDKAIPICSVLAEHPLFKKLMKQDS